MGNKTIPKRKVKNSQGKTTVLTPFERDLDFVGFVKFQADSREIGAYLSRKGDGNYRITFAFDTQGFEATMTEMAVESTLAQIEGAFKDLPPKETLTFHMSSFSEDIDKQLELNQQIDKVRNSKNSNQVDRKVLEAFIFSRKERIGQLRVAGLRKPKQLTIFATYTYEPNEGESDVVEKSLNTILKFFRKNVTQQYGSIQHQKLNNFLKLAYENGFKGWERLLSSKMGLSIQPQSAEEIWQNLWRRFNPKTPAIPIPAYLVFDGKTTTDYKGHTRLSVGSLLQYEDTATPMSTRGYVHCSKYQGLLQLQELPDGWLDGQAQLRYIWNVMSDPEITDTEVITQVTLGNVRLMVDKLSTMTKQAIGKAADAANNGSVNVKANVDAQRAVEAQELLYKGALPLRVSTVFIIHRDEIESLEESCRILSNKLTSPAWLVKECDDSWNPWLQTFTGLVWDRLYATPSDLRYSCTTEEIQGFIPLVKPTSPDRRGFELIAAEGNEPLFIDLYGSETKRIGIFAASRGGKSVNVSGMIAEALEHDIPVSIIDYPREDGTGTFSEVVPLLDGAYFNILNEFYNIFELPKLRGFDRETQELRLNDFKDSLLEILQTIVVGTDDEVKNKTEIRSVLVIAMDAFMKETSIKRRYKDAANQGFGSDAWQQIPTLEDYIEFCTPARIDTPNASQSLISAIGYINLKLKSFIKTKIGISLSSPSSFKSDAQIFAVALAKLSNPEEAVIIAMATNLVILRRSLGYSKSIVFIDEAPILFSFEAIAKQIGFYFAAGGKSGITVILSAQEPGSIYQSPHGAKVFASMDAFLIGRIKGAAVQAFVNILQVPLEMAKKCASKDFFPKGEGLYSQWMLCANESFTLCRYYPSRLLIGAVANNKPETEIRLRCLEKYPNKIEALIAASNEIIDLIQGKASPP
jgi:hypothetical protein